MNDDEITALIEKRNVLRKAKQYAEADVIKQSLKVKVPGIKILDTPFKQGGGSTWFIEVVLPSDVSLVELSKEVFRINDPTCDTVTAIVQQAKHYCDLCELHRGKYEGKLRPSDAQGRQWADAAFHFAMGGVRDDGLYAGLVEGARAELRRVGNRKSFRTIDIIQMAEKFAGAGVVDQSLYLAISDLVREKTPAGVSLPDSLCDLQSGKYMLLSDRPLFSLFRFAARQSKHGRQREYAMEEDEDDSEGEEEEEEEKEEDSPRDTSDGIGADTDSASFTQLQIPADFDINCLFEKSTLPLVLDLGCGYGVSLLGLSYTHAQDASSEKFNYLGCDMSARSINYAKSISRRWNMHNQCAFIVSDIVRALQLVRNYSGTVHWVSINFPTPYRQAMIPEMIQKFSLSSGTGEEIKTSASSTPAAPEVSCNSQLPSLISDFMVTSEVFQLIESIFCSSMKIEGHKSFLYLQSNVQDVAVVMNGMFHSYLQGSRSSQDHLSIISETSPCVASEIGGSACVTKKRKHQDVEVDAASPVIPSKRQLLWSEKGGKTSLRGFVTVTSTESNDTPPSRSRNSRFVEGSEFWLEDSPLPHLARTETEVMCKYNNKPVYRQLYSFTTTR